MCTSWRCLQSERGTSKEEEERVVVSGIDAVNGVMEKGIGRSSNVERGLRPTPLSAPLPRGDYPLRRVASASGRGLGESRHGRWGTSIILSASWARSSRLLASLEANTTRTLGGRHWRKSSRRRVPSVAVALSPSSCCIPGEVIARVCGHPTLSSEKAAVVFAARVE